MCTGLEYAALAAAVGGTGAAAAGNASVRKQGAKAQNLQTETSRDEFDRRTQLADEIFKENTGISRQTYDDLTKLSDDEFQQRTGVAKDTFNQLSEVERNQIIRDAAASLQNVDEISGARTLRDTAQDAALSTMDADRAAARSQYANTLSGANERQAGFRGEADTEASKLVDFFQPGAAAQRQTAAAGARDTLVGSAMTVPTAPSVAGRMDPALAAIFDRYRQTGLDKARTTAGATSKVAGYTDAVQAGDRGIAKTGENVAFIADRAKRALAPLGAQLDVSSLKFNNAADTGATRFGAAGDFYNGRTRNADADLDAALNLSGTRAQGEAKPINQYGADSDAALARFFTGRTNSVAGRGDALMGANETRLAGTNSASSNLESSMNNITQFRMGSASPGFAGFSSSLLSALTPTLFNQATQGGTGFGFRKPAAPPKTT